jgi:hypothetical protein
MKTRPLPALLAATLVSAQATSPAVARAQPAPAPAVAQPALPPAPAATPSFPPQSPPAPREESEEATVHVLGAQDDSDVQLLLRTNQGYEALCTAPCDAHLSRGTHRFALSREGGKAVEVAEAVTVSGPGTMRATYESRTGMRTAGVVILVPSAGAMIVGLTIALVDSANSFGPDVGAGLSGNPSPAHSGAPEVVAVIGLVGTLLSLPFLLARDHATVEIVPATTARILPGTTREGAFVPPSDSHGLALRVRF